jgi:hypothetical protein
MMKRRTLVTLVAGAMLAAAPAFAQFQERTIKFTNPSRSSRSAPSSSPTA